MIHTLLKVTKKQTLKISEILKHSHEFLKRCIPGTTYSGDICSKYKSSTTQECVNSQKRVKYCKISE